MVLVHPAEGDTRPLRRWRLLSSSSRKSEKAKNKCFICCAVYNNNYVNCRRRRHCLLCRKPPTRRRPKMTVGMINYMSLTSPFQLQQKQPLSSDSACMITQQLPWRTSSISSPSSSFFSRPPICCHSELSTTGLQLSSGDKEAEAAS